MQISPSRKWKDWKKGPSSYRPWKWRSPWRANAQSHLSEAL